MIPGKFKACEGCAQQCEDPHWQSCTKDFRYGTKPPQSEQEVWCNSKATLQHQVMSSGVSVVKKRLTACSQTSTC